MSRVLAINAGSSSVKFAVFTADVAPRELLRGHVDGTGADARLFVDGAERDLAGGVALRPMPIILGVLEASDDDHDISVVSHRIVHGGAEFTHPEFLTPDVMEKLTALEPLAPLHQPHDLAIVRDAMAVFPDAAQVGCFDTAFHAGKPLEANCYALPRALYAEGVRRYGFHGLSYDYISGALRARHPDLARGRVVIAHLGSGASLAAVVDGVSVATTMGFSALDGLPMGTRTGDLDPGVLLYLMDQKGMDSAALSQFLYQKCGLLGLSGISNDMRVLEASAAPEADEAITYATYRVRREIGAMAAAMGGIDGIVFTGGIGENSVRVRSEVLAGLEFLGFALDAAANAAKAGSIGGAGKPVLVMPTNEEVVIARGAVAKRL